MTPLDKIEINQPAIILSFVGGEKMVQRLTQHGIYPGDTIRILRQAPLDGPYLVVVSGREIILGRSLVSKIQVEVSAE